MEQVLIEVTSHRARERATRAGLIEAPGWYYWPVDGPVPHQDFYKIDSDKLDDALRIPGIKRRSRPDVNDPDLHLRWH